MTKRPNVLFVFSDQHRADALGCYGNPYVSTPNLDAFARQGARLTTAISTTPVCGPFRACLLTGRYAHHCGYPTNGLRFEPLGPCIAERFKAAGYATGYIGKWHLHFPSPADGEEAGGPGFVPPAARHGFDDFWAASNGGHRYYRWQYFRDADPTPIEAEGYRPETEVDLALEFIQQHDQEPWCLFMSWGPPHTPFDPPPGYAERYADVPLPANVPPGRPQAYARDVLPRYYGLVQSLDDAFGRLMAGLDKLGQSEETLVVYTSDHGDVLGSHGFRGNKRWPYDASIRVPFLIRQPGRIPAGHTVRRPLGTPDIYPTLLALAGLPVPNGLDGASQAEAVLDPNSAVEDRFIYCTMPYAYVPWPGWRALRSSRYLYARAREAPWLLYDYEADPHELHNLIDHHGHAELRDELDARLTARMAELGDCWDFGVEAGDWRLWSEPGTSKMEHNDLGVPWPGCR